MIYLHKEEPIVKQHILNNNEQSFINQIQLLYSIGLYKSWEIRSSANCCKKCLEARIHYPNFEIELQLLNCHAFV